MRLRYILGQNPVDDGLDFFRTHVLGVGIGSGVLLGGHGLLRLFGNSRIVLIGVFRVGIRAGLTGLGQKGPPVGSYGSGHVRCPTL